MMDVHVKSGTGTADMTVAEQEMIEPDSVCERIHSYLKENLEEILNNNFYRRSLQDIMWILRIPNGVSPFSRSSEYPEMTRVLIENAIPNISEWLASNDKVRRLFEGVGACPELDTFFKRLLDLEEIQFIHRNQMVNGICLALGGSYANNPMKMITTLQGYVKGCASESEDNRGCSSDCKHRFDLMAAVRQVDSSVISYKNKDTISWILWTVKRKYFRWRRSINTTLEDTTYSWKKLQLMLAHFYKRLTRYSKPGNNKQRENEPSDESFSYESFSFLSCPRDGAPSIYDEAGETEGLRLRQGMSADAVRQEVGTAVTDITAKTPYEYLVRPEQIDVMILLVEVCLQLSSLVWILEPFGSLGEGGEGKIVEICRILKRIHGVLEDRGNCGDLSKEFFMILIGDERFRELLINMGGNGARRGVVEYIISSLAIPLELLCGEAACRCESGQGLDDQGQTGQFAVSSESQLTEAGLNDDIMSITSKELLGLLLPFTQHGLIICQVRARRARGVGQEDRMNEEEGSISGSEMPMIRASVRAINRAKENAEKLRRIANLGSYIENLDSQTGGDALISVGEAEACIGEILE